MPLLIPTYREPEATESESTRYFFVAEFSLDVSGESAGVLEAAVDVTAQMDSGEFNAALDVENGDFIPMIIDLVNEDLR